MSIFATNKTPASETEGELLNTLNIKTQSHKHSKKEVQLGESSQKPSAKVFVQQPIVRLLFNLDNTKQRVTLVASCDTDVIDFGERTYNSLLLLLAQKRISDIKEGVAPSEQGWQSSAYIDSVLSITEQHRNIQVYRFRKQVSELFSSQPLMSKIIERRKGQLRLNNVDIKIKNESNKKLAAFEL